MNNRSFHVEEVTRRLGLTCIEDLTHRGSTSDLVLRVRDAGGAEYLLKRVPPELAAHEVAALRAWNASGVTPPLIEELEPGLCLLEWLDGRSLAEVPADEPVPGVDIGRALAALHRTAPPAGTTDVRSVLDSHEWKLLPPRLHRLAEWLTTVLRGHDPPVPVLLHSDLVPANVLLTPGGPRFIDPVGWSGLPTWDLAQLVASAAGRGRRDLLAPLLEGYGPRPPLLAEAFAWMLLFYLEKNLAFPDSPFAPNLLPIARRLGEEGDVEKLLRGYLSGAWR